MPIKIGHLPRVTLAGLVAAALVCAIAGVLRFVLPAASAPNGLIQVAQLPSSQMPNVNGNCNAVGTQNTVTNSCNTAPLPRTIDAAAGTLIAQTAREAGSFKFGVWLTGNDPDVGPYSYRLIASLQNGGWIGNFVGSTMVSFPPPSDIGLHLCGKSTAPPQAAKALLKVLVLSKQDVSRIYATCDKFGAGFNNSTVVKYDDEFVGIIIGRDGPSSP